MEFVPLSTDLLDVLARKDGQLRNHFRGVFAADPLPWYRSLTPAERGYIVNTDPADKPGQHWLALWVKKNCSEVFDSYGLPLTVYADPELHRWLGVFKYLTHSGQTLQALDSQACGHYALQYIRAHQEGFLKVYLEVYVGFLEVCCRKIPKT